MDFDETIASSSDLVIDKIENDDKGQRIPKFYMGTGFLLKKRM